MRLLRHYIAVLLFVAPMVSSAQDLSLGEINVYTFKLDSLFNKDGSGKALYAVGKDYSAELFCTKVGDNIFFKILIDGKSYSVIDNPYEKKVSSSNYVSAGYWKDGKWEHFPGLSYTAGPYFLQLPKSITSSTNNQKQGVSQNRNTTQTITRTLTKTEAPQWRLMGKVTVTSDIEIRDNGKDIHYEEETAFLYSASDGKTEKYKITIPRTGIEYDVSRNSSYNGARIQWSSNGKYVRSVPDLSEMYTHHAGGYYFNISSVKM